MDDNIVAVIAKGRQEIDTQGKRDEIEYDNEPYSYYLTFGNSVNPLCL